MRRRRASRNAPLNVVGYRIGRLRAAGRIPYKGRPWTVPETARLLAALDAGARYRALAPSFDRSPAALLQHAMLARRARRAAEAAADRDQLRFDLAA